MGFKTNGVEARRVQAMNRRQDILRRAAELFSRKGVARTSIEDIASAVGIKREGVYYYFKTRGEILLEIILPQSNSLLLSLQRVMRSRVSSIDKLHAAVEIHLDAYNPAYIEMSVALKEDHFALGEERLNDLRRVWDAYGVLWVDLVREGQQAGEFKPDLDPKLVAFGLLGMCNWVSRWYSPGHGYTITQIIETFFSMASTGIQAAPMPVVLADKPAFNASSVAN
jgi:TetR/AcrR family transcriptional regulator, cholesterol catabolism regulator